MESRSTGRPVNSTVQGPQTRSRPANLYVLPTDRIPITECGRSVKELRHFLCVTGRKVQNVLLSLDGTAQHTSPEATMRQWNKAVNSPMPVAASAV
jgi:hypothetical protein